MAYWVCDPEKNIFCKKTTCFLNGGKCHLTSDIRYGTSNAPLSIDEGWHLNAKLRHKGPYKSRKKSKEGTI